MKSIIYNFKSKSFIFLRKTFLFIINNYNKYFTKLNITHLLNLIIVKPKWCEANEQFHEVKIANDLLQEQFYSTNNFSILVNYFLIEFISQGK